MTVINLPSAWLPIADAIVKATIVLTLAAAASLILRRASAALRHLIWMLALCSALLLPLLTVALPKWQLALFTVADQPSVEALVAAPDGDLHAAPPKRTAATRSPSFAAETPTAVAAPLGVAKQAPSWLKTIGWQQVLFALWIAGALLILGRIVVGLAAIHFLSRRTQQITNASWLPMARALASELVISPRLRFLRSGRAAMPVAAGVFRPLVIMPSDAETWTENRLRLVLLHELAHVKRRDCLTHLLAQAACAFYWFNPLAWIAVKRARTERERACDDLVLACGTRGSDYADQLIEMARVLRGGRFPMLLAGASLAMAHRSQLEGRLMAILDPRVPRAGLTRGRALVAVALCVVAVASLGALQPWTEGAGAALVSTRSNATAHTAATEPHVIGDINAGVTSTLRSGSPNHLNTHATAAAQERAEMQPRPPVQVLQPMQPAQAPRLSPQPHPHPMPVANEIIAPMAQAAADAVADAIASGAAADAVADAFANAWEAPGIAAARGRGRGNRAEQADPRLLAALISALKDTDKEVRETAMQALVKMRDPVIFDPLVQALKDGSPDVREQAAFGLGQLRDKRAVQPLIAALKEDTNASVREQAVFALGQLRDPVAVEGLTVALRDANPSVREQAAFSLGQIKDKRAVEPLISALKDANASVREQAAFALGQLRERAAVEALIIAVKDTNASVREQVVFALGQLHDPRAIDALTEALKDTSADVRQQAAFALGQLVR